MLHITHFKFKLLFVSKITKELEFYIFYDPVNGKVRAIGREDRDMYILPSLNSSKFGKKLVGISWLLQIISIHQLKIK